VSETVHTHVPDPDAALDAGFDGVTPPANPERGSAFLSDVIAELGFADVQTITEAEEAARRSEQRLEKLLVETGILDEEQLSRAIAERNGLDHVDLERFPIDPAAGELIGRAAAERYHAVPIAFDEDGSIVVAVEDPLDTLGISDIEVMTKSEVRRVIAGPSAISRVIEGLPKLARPSARASAGDSKDEEAVMEDSVPTETDSGNHVAGEAAAEAVPQPPSQPPPVSEPPSEPPPVSEDSATEPELPETVVPEPAAVAAAQSNGAGGDVFGGPPPPPPGADVQPAEPGQEVFEAPPEGEFPPEPAPSPEPEPEPAPTPQPAAEDGLDELSSGLLALRDEASRADELATTLGRRLEELEGTDERAQRLEAELAVARERIAELEQRSSDVDAAVDDVRRATEQLGSLRETLEAGVRGS
jgi:hypothetical protein